MKESTKGLAMLVLVAFGVVGCQRAAPVLSNDVDGLQSVLESLNNSTQLVLYEGLPHQLYEPEVLTKELASKETIELHGYHFYKELLLWKNDDQKSVVELIKSPKRYRKRNVNATKACGGYHPDYCLQWNQGEKVYQLQFCFGCYEVKFFGPNLGVYCDLHDTDHKLYKVLETYRKNRPKFQRFQK